jgi:UDP-N-acetylglucosamine 3-dehydrogenase
MKKIGYGVIGLGFFGEKHIEALSTIPNVEIIGACTRRKERLNEIAKKFNIKNVYTDYNELLKNPDIDVVSITTHIDTHLKPTVAALNAGKNVFLEKPMAGSLKECDEIINAVKKSKKIFMVGHICRFDPRYAIAKKEIEEGKIGKIVSIYARRNIPAKVSGSVLEKISPIVGDGVHDTDLMLWFTGKKVKTVYARSVSVRNLPNADLGWAMYEFENGAVGVIESVWFLPDKTPYPLDARMEIIGTEGAIYIDSGQSFAVNDKDGLRYPEVVYWPSVNGVRSGVLRDELLYFINCVISGKQPDVITPEESKSAVEVVLSAEKSTKTGEVIKI